MNSLVLIKKYLNIVEVFVLVKQMWGTTLIMVFSVTYYLDLRSATIIY